MGRAVGIAGIAGVETEALERALSQVFEDQDFKIKAVSRRHSAPDPVMVHVTDQGRMSILLPRGVDYAAFSAGLSKILETPVLAFETTRKGGWLYRLFLNGQTVDGFTPAPERLNGASQQVLLRPTSNAAVIACHWPGVREQRIARYLVAWNSDRTGKAYPGDEHAYGDAKQMRDFMRSLGLPSDAERDAAACETQLYVLEPQKSRTVAKPAAKKVARKVAKPAAKKPVKKVAKPAAKKVARKVAKPVAKKPVKKVAKPAAKKVARKVAKPVAKKPVKKVAKPVAKKVARKVAKPAAKKPVKKVAKPVAKKVARKVAKPAAKKATRKAAKPAKKTIKKKVNKIDSSAVKRSTNRLSTSVKKKTRASSPTSTKRKAAAPGGGQGRQRSTSRRAASPRG